MPNLADYENDVGWLLHDVNHLFTPLSQLDRWINQARDRVAQDSGCLRALVAGQSPFGATATAGNAVPGGAVPGQAAFTTFNTIPSQEFYPYSYATQIGAAQNRGFRAVIDVFTCAVSWGGAIRPVQNWMPWDQLQAYARSYNVGVFSYPFVWATSGAGASNRLWLWPAPSVITEMEWDCGFVPKPLNTNDDYEAIPEPFQGAVKYWAARDAAYAKRDYGQANEMEKQYWSSLVKAGSSSDRSKIPDYYVDWTTWG